MDTTDRPRPSRDQGTASAQETGWVADLAEFLGAYAPAELCLETWIDRIERRR